MSERAKFRGYLAEAKEKETRLEVKIGGLVAALRGQLDPFADPGDLETEVIGQQALELHDAQTELRRVRAEIKRINQVLEG